MISKSDVHVNPTGDNWEVEDHVQTLAQAETKEEAIDAAKEAAAEKGAEKIVIHTHDGGVEREIAVPPAANDPSQAP